jgi:hypothetical protein
MNKLNSDVIALIACAGLLAGMTGCKVVSKSEGQSKIKILQQPESQLVRTGDLAGFSVEVSPSKGVAYQWQFNGSNILRATEATYRIPHPVDFADVGEYQVLITGNGTTISKPAYLSVYSLTRTLSVTSGTLSTPVNQFQTMTYQCGGGAFQKGYTPINSSGLTMFFYGPNATGQSGIFTNLGHAPTLTIDTFSTDNGTADTGIRLQNNWIPLADACCNDDATGGTDPKQSRCQIALSQNAGGVSQKNSYRLSVLYKVPPGPPTSGRVTFNWRYE